MRLANRPLSVSKAHVNLILAVLKDGHSLAHRGECGGRDGVLDGPIPKKAPVAGQGGVPHPGPLSIWEFLQWSQS
jgi:hypothetical protein